MIPTFIFLMVKRYQKNHPEQFRQLISKIRVTLKLLFFLLIALAFARIAQGQEKKLSYTVKRNGSNVGTLNIREHKNGTRTIYKMDSEVKMKLLVSFKVIAIEEAMYDNGILIYSSVYQKMNGDEQANTKTKICNNNYIIDDDGEVESLGQYPIRYNMVCVYTCEPVNVRQIYSDKYQKFLPLQQMAPHHYKISFPNGASNEYFYQNGICTTIKVNHGMYKAEMILN